MYSPMKIDLVSIQIAEVILRFGSSGSSETFVVLDFPLVSAVELFLPSLVLGNREENLLGFSLGALDDRSDELLEETFHLQQRGPVEMEEVYQ